MNLAIKGIMFLLVLMASVLSQAEIRAPRPEVSVKSSAEVVENKPVLVMDIATIGFVDLTQAQSVLSLVLFNGPTEGEKLTYKNSDLVRIVKAKIGENPDLSVLKWTYFIPDSVELVGKKSLISPLGAENQIKMAILAKCADCKVNIKDLRIPNTGGDGAAKNCLLQTDNLKMGGTFLLPIQCESSGQTKTFWISGTAKVLKTAPISSRQISPGDRITAKDFRLGEVDLTYARDGVPSGAEIEGQIASRLIQVNQPIFKNDIKKELAVSRGQTIRAVAGDDTFEVSSPAVAEDQGFIGDTVRVKSSENQKMLSGVIVEKGVVKLQ